jgi:TP901 family phage tail tape measure protein
MAQTVGELEVLIGGDAKALESELREAEAALKKVADRLSKKGDEMVAAATSGAKAATERVTTGSRAAFAQIAQGAISAGDTISQRIGGPLLALAKDSLKAAGGFEQGLSILKQASGATGAEMEKLSKIAQQLGTDATLPGVAARDALDAANALAKGGLTVVETTEAMRGAVQLATAASQGFAESADFMANAVKSFGLEGSQATRIADLLAGAANKSTASITDMQQAFQAGATVARQAGLTVSEFTTALTAMANAGIRGSDAGTSIKSMLMALSSPTSDKAKETLKKLEVSIYDANGAMKPFLKIIGELDAALSKYNDQARNTSLANIFGSDGIRAAVIAMREGEDGLRRLEAEISKQGFASDVAKAKMTGWTGALETLNNELDNLKLELGNSVLPVMTDLLKTVTSSVKWFSDLPRPVQEATAKLVLAGVAASKVASGLQTIIGLQASYVAATGSMSAGNAGVAASATGASAALARMAAAAKTVALAAGTALIGWEIGSAASRELDKAARERHGADDFGSLLSGEHAKQKSYDKPAQAFLDMFERRKKDFDAAAAARKQFNSSMLVESLFPKPDPADTTRRVQAWDQSTNAMMGAIKANSDRFLASLEGSTKKAKAAAKKVVEEDLKPMNVSPESLGLPVGQFWNSKWLEPYSALFERLSAISDEAAQSVTASFTAAFSKNQKSGIEFIETLDSAFKAYDTILSRLKTSISTELDPRGKVSDWLGIELKYYKAIDGTMQKTLVRMKLQEALLLKQVRGASLKAGLLSFGAKDSNYQLPEIDTGFSDQYLDRLAREMEKSIPRAEDLLGPVQLSEAAMSDLANAMNATYAGAYALLDKNTQKAKEFADVMQNVASAGMSAMQGMIDDIWDNGFSNLFENVTRGFSDMLSEMARSYIQSQVFNVFSGVLNNALGIPARAMGGPVSGGQPYLVGERGPELFVPSSSGRVEPNSSLGGTTNIYITVNLTGGSAADRRSGQQIASEVAQRVEQARRRA